MHATNAIPNIPAFGCAICVGYQESEVRGQKWENPSCLCTNLPTIKPLRAPTVFDNPQHPERAALRPKESLLLLHGQTAMVYAHACSHGAGERYLPEIDALLPRGLGLVQGIDKSHQIVLQRVFGEGSAPNRALN